MKEVKTNAMRMLDRLKIEYYVNTYEVSESHMDGKTVAEKVGVDVSQVYKTLVLENAKHAHFVFIIPVNASLDMKSAAQAVNEKKLQLMPLDDLKKVTGYVRGGCSPIGMKRQFPTIIDRQVEEIDAIYVSGGARGTQIKIDVAHLIRTTRAKVKKVTHDEHN
ncbi:MAG: Cys-tRNA(Pro) deacylase [Staphylococcus equorum]|uniref:Cys-tRNA(Pro) deacylase n=1 Tax=Staphylococcus equorum TaxID=246432 RepID=UPI00085393A2|nr:Cys-tRNA(Pro) deacylase [Staphylococcus equorum]OEL07968.1 aminoacyl-tRNA deacylase [Staphylococcus equorum]